MRWKGTCWGGAWSHGRRLAREKANGCLGWPHGIESQRIPGHAMTGIGPDVVKPPRSRTTSVVSVSRCVCPLTAAGLRDGIEVEQACLYLAWPGESFSGLGAIARESVGQLLPGATPQSSAWRSHLARRTLTLGAASLKARCYDTAMQRLPRRSLVLRSCYALPGTPLPSHGGHIIHRTTMM